MQRDRGGTLAAVPAAKIHFPAPPGRLIDRARLSDLLNLDDAPVVLVCAPAGYGKTTLVSTWAARESSRGHPVAWVQLDADDNDPFRLWSAILRAIGAVADAPVLDRLGAPTGHLERGFLAALVNAIDERETFVCLVLDDVHMIHDPTTLAGLNRLLGYLPRQLQLIIFARSEPALAELQRMRLGGRLHEIRTSTLAFRRDEAVALLATHNVHLCESDLELVLTRTEGWPAGLRMAGISLARADDPSAAVAAFVEDDQNAADYLFAVVLDQLPPDIRRFVMATSICERFTVELAKAITGYDGAEVLQRMEEANALIVRTGPRRLWYRYHSLLRSYLYAELQRSEPIEPLHRRAAAWFEATGDFPAALEHAIAGGDPADVVRIVTEHGVRMVVSGSSATVLLLLRDAPATMLALPEVALVEALAAVNAGNGPLADLRLASVAPEIDYHSAPRLRHLYATVRLLRARQAADVTSALAADAMLTDSDTGDVDLDLIVRASQGVAALWLDGARSAKAHLIRAHALAVRTKNDNIALYCYTRLGAAKIAEDDLVEAGRIAIEAIRYAAVRGWDRSPRCAYAYGLAAWSAYYRADHEAALKYATLAMSVLDESVDPPAELSARTADAAVRFDRADQRAALLDWQAAWAKLGRYAQRAAQVAFSAPVELRMALALGEVSSAFEVIDRVRSVPGTERDVQVLRAMLTARRGRGAVARRLLQPVLAGRPPAALTTRTEAWLLEALLADAEADDEAAYQAIESAVMLAAPQRLLRPFYDSGTQLRALLSRLAGRLGRHDSFIADALAVVPADGPRQPDLLTPREMRLLAELPSMATAEQLAERLFVSTSTVKTHLRGIYRKLGVTSRRDAVIAGRQRGLI